jgi:hypothetical protein
MRELNDQFENWINIFLGLEGLRYESRLDLFFGSGCVGFLLGYLYYHSNLWGRWRFTAVVVIGALLMALNAAIGPDYFISPFNLFASEYKGAESFAGILSIWGTIAVFIYSALVIDRHFIPLRIAVVHWCGEHSLLVFSLHLVLFIRVIIPLRMYIAHVCEAPMRNGLMQGVFYTAVVICVSWLIRRSRILCLLQR